VPATSPHEPIGPSLEAYLLGRLEYDVALALQNRLVYETSGRDDGQIALLMCEHPSTLAVGRRGSRAHIELSPRELTSRKLPVRWVNHGGGCLVHTPGQLAIYPIVPLAWHKLSLGEYLHRLHAVLRNVLGELKIKVHDRPADTNGCNGFAGGSGSNGAANAGVNGHGNGRHHEPAPATDAPAATATPPQLGVWGRTGQLAAMAVAVKHGITYHGAFINVAPAMEVFRGVVSDPVQGSPMSCLVAERQQPVRMTTVREAVVRHMCQAFECQRFHVHTGHPLLPQIALTVRESARVG
jgi:lipoyl(octanoyl) transferase